MSTPAHPASLASTALCPAAFISAADLTSLSGTPADVAYWRASGTPSAAASSINIHAKWYFAAALPSWIAFSKHAFASTACLLPKNKPRLTSHSRRSSSHKTFAPTRSSTEKRAKRQGTSVLSWIGSPVDGDVPFSANHFSTASRSYTCPSAMVTGSTKSSPVMEHLNRAVMVRSVSSFLAHFVGHSRMSSEGSAIATRSPSPPTIRVPKESCIFPCRLFYDVGKAGYCHTGT
mmetsp:Transcript_9103/g.23813  ORF Transcript_9103/g.23813 Transcript_9103/m.23813 type:complete len:233 (+) Transcript_9103:343-1041(+)